ncbi:Glycerophosphodiester phosphodiesterase [Bertholletia excelsa]
MEQKITLSIFIIFTLFLLPQNTSSVNPQYKACQPKPCGTQIISFPFRIQNVQQPFCGYPGFDLKCHRNQTILHISNQDYTVEQIFYHNHSLRIYNSPLTDYLARGCFPHIGNLSIPKNYKFAIVPPVSDLFLLSNCSSFPANLSGYRIGCGRNWGAGVFAGDKILRFVRKQCEREEVVQVALEGGERTYFAVARRGILVNWTASNCSLCERSGGRCGFDVGTYLFKCFCSDRPHASHCRSGIAAIGIVIITLLIRYCMRKKFLSYWKSEKGDDRSMKAFVKNFGSEIAPRRYSYLEVKKMTTNFKNKLGQGGFGCVYRGKLNNGQCVAVKVLKESKGNGEEFINEVASISQTSHVNIVRLLGFCFEGHKRALVYEFLPNGSLEKFICNKNFSTECKLGGETLYKIAIGIARGLEYLHVGCKTRILHFDIKPHNILLDKDFCPKISDFGLSKLCLNRESNITTLGARGTIGYIAPEIFSRNFGRISYKSDVYSYGIMILEMTSGRSNSNVDISHTSETYFPHWIYKRLKLDEEIGTHGVTNEFENERVRKMIIIGLWCIQIDPSDRPSMTKVIEMLEGSLENLPIPPRPYLSSPAREPIDSSTI